MLHLQYPGFLATSQDPAGDADPNLSQLCEMTGGEKEKYCFGSQGVY